MENTEFIYRSQDFITDFTAQPKNTTISVMIPKHNGIIETLEGNFKVDKDKDYIIKGLAGEIYAIKKDIFDLKYQIVDDNQYSFGFGQSDE